MVVEHFTIPATFGTYEIVNAIYENARPQMMRDRFAVLTAWFNGAMEFVTGMDNTAEISDSDEARRAFAIGARGKVPEEIIRKARHQREMNRK